MVAPASGMKSFFSKGGPSFFLRRDAREKLVARDAVLLDPDERFGRRARRSPSSRRSRIRTPRGG